MTLTTPITRQRPAAVGAASGEPGDRPGALAPPVIRLMASARVAGSRSWPRTAEVTVRAPGLRTPRIDMHRCSHSTTTITPRGCRCVDRARRRSGWSAAPAPAGGGRSTSTSRASLDRPVTRPSFAGDVADVRDAVERHQVVLAGRVHLDVARPGPARRGRARRSWSGTSRRRPGRRPAKISAYARATRAGVSRSPSRSGSSPIGEQDLADGAPRRAGWSITGRRRSGRVGGRRSAAGGARARATARRPPTVGVLVAAGAGPVPVAMRRRSRPGSCDRRAASLTGRRSLDSHDRRARALADVREDLGELVPCRASPSRAARATSPSRTSRFSTRISQASSCASSISRRTSSSTTPATSSE